MQLAGSKLAIRGFVKRLNRTRCITVIVWRFGVRHYQATGN